MKKESYVDSSDYENDDHIKDVIHKIFRPDNAYIKFDFLNGRPQKSAILTTSSINMAKRYYYAIKEMTADPKWLEKEFKDHPIRKGRTIEDVDFPRIAITYSMQENEENAKAIQDEMKEIILDYNRYYNTAWTIEEVNRYNNDINNRLARKKGEFKKFGNHLDLVIVVDRLLTGFDAPTIQTLFVDRMLSYANLIQAFSRTNRTYPGKEKGLIVTYRKPATFEYNVEEATKLYSQVQEETALVYPSYEKSMGRFIAAYDKFRQILDQNAEISEHSPIGERVDFVKSFQELNKSFEALVTYNEYNDEIESSERLSDQVKILEGYVGLYNTLKGSLVADEPDDPDVDFSGVEFFRE